MKKLEGWSRSHNRPLSLPPPEKVLFHAILWGWGKKGRELMQGKEGRTGKRREA